jgi:hypothetical protein
MRAAIQRAIVLAGLGLIFSFPCTARTFVVVDTTTGKPIAGANVRLIARERAPIGMGHAGEFTIGEWERTSDENGEISLSSAGADRAWVTQIEKPCYGRTETVHEYKFRRSDKANPDVLFLTPSSDLAFEKIRFGYFTAAHAVDNNERIAGSAAIAGIATSYAHSRLVAKTVRELEALRQFCRFAPAMAAQRKAGWPDVGPLPELRSVAQTLIDDCSDAPPSASTPSNEPAACDANPQVRRTRASPARPLHRNEKPDRVQ